MADKPVPGHLGAGSAADAARKLKGRRQQIDEAVDGATGDATTMPLNPPAPADSEKKIPPSMIQRMIRKLRGQ